MQPARLLAYKMFYGVIPENRICAAPHLWDGAFFFPHRGDKAQGCIFSLNNPRLFRRGDGLAVLGESFRRYIVSQS